MKIGSKKVLLMFQGEDIDLDCHTRCVTSQPEIKNVRLRKKVPEKWFSLKGNNAKK